LLVPRTIRLCTLGALDLRAPPSSGLDPAAVLRQPKRLALLAYLAAAAPRRFHRRDTLLGLFWPELDESHARAALRRSLYFLRNALGAETITARGEDEVGVPEEALWCDAGAMERALDRGETERALELYQGPFLEGLHVEGAGTELQDWLDRERARLRDRALAAAGALAETSMRQGRREAAEAWAGRGTQIAGDDETARARVAVLLEPGGAAAADTIAVLPFTVRGDERFAYLGEGMVALLATRLDGAGTVRTVDPRALLRHVAGGADGPAAARHFGAGHWLTGTIVEAGGRLRVTASLYPAGGERAETTMDAVAGDETELFELVDELARQLLATGRGAPGSRLARLAARTTTSLDALRAYLLGEGHLRGGRYFDALEQFQAAVDRDPSFALAWYHLSAAAAGCALPDAAREAAERGQAHRERLAPHDRLVLDAQRAWLEGAIAEAEALFNTVTGTYPDDVEAWFHLGDLLFHTNPLRGRSATEARAPFERLLRLDPEHVGALVHLARIAAIEGRREDAIGLADRGLRAGPDGDQALAMRALRAHLAGDGDAIAAVSRELRSARAITVGIAFADVALYARDLDGAAALARSFIEVARAPELRALCHVQLAHLALAQGNLSAVWTELADAERLDRAWGLETRGLFASLPFVPLEREEIVRTRDDLAAWEPGAGTAGGLLVLAMHQTLHPAIRLYLLGLLELRLGDGSAAARWSAELERMSPDSEGLVPSFAAELGAARLRADGRTDEALRVLERSTPRLWFQLTVASPFFSLASRRWLQAELLREAGRTGEAAGWYRSIAERSPYELIYTTPARARLERPLLSS
jgi:serine/threonine-protein kinase